MAVNKRLTNKQQREKTLAKKQLEEKERLRARAIMAPPVTTVSMYDYMIVKKRI